MLIKIQLDDDLVERMKLLTDTKTGAKAVSFAAQTYPDQLNMTARLERENGELKEKCRVQQQTINRARDAAAALLDHVAQGGLLDA